MSELGYFTAKEFQLRTLSRIVGGHSVIGIAPDGAGKTTTYVLGVLMRLKYTDDEAPKVLILAPNEERISEIVERFYTISKNFFQIHHNARTSNYPIRLDNSLLSVEFNAESRANIQLTFYGDFGGESVGDAFYDRKTDS